MKLYATPGSPNCLKVLIAARELGLSLDIENLTIEALKQPEYRAIHPLAMVPALRDGELTLWESGAILQHLAAKDGRGTLLPNEPMARADTWRWMTFYSAHLHPHIYLLGWERLIKRMITGVADADPQRVAFAEEQLARCLPVIETRLTRGDHLGQYYGIADIAAGVSCSTLGHFLGFDLAPYPAISRWLGRLSEREAWRAVLSR